MKKFLGNVLMLSIMLTALPVTFNAALAQTTRRPTGTSASANVPAWVATVKAGTDNVIAAANNLKNTAASGDATATKAAAAALVDAANDVLDAIP